MPQASSDLYLAIEGAGRWSATIPYSLDSVPPTVATDVLELSLGEAVEWFIANYMDLRFHPFYARRNLGYVIQQKTWLKKQRRSRVYNKDAVLPNVWTGNTRDAAKASRAETRAVGGRRSRVVGAKIRMNLPGYINQQRSKITNKVLRTITPDEGKRVADHFFKAVAEKASRFVEVEKKTRKGTIVSRTAAPSDVAQFRRTNRATIIATRGVANAG
jgi:hypothetical protein